MPDDTESDHVRMTMTIPEDTEEWLLESYPDSLELTEAVRMAINDARAFQSLGDRVKSAEYQDR